MTPQRELVLNVLHEIEGFASAEEIYARVRQLSTAVDISTVYRALDLFQEFGLVTCVEGADGQRRYDLVTDHGPHIHLVCTNCGEVIGAAPEVLAASLSHILEQYGFAVDMAQLQLPGLCARCRATEKAAVHPDPQAGAGAPSTNETRMHE